MTGARCGLTLSVGLDSLYALCDLRRCASLFPMWLDSLNAQFSMMKCTLFPMYVFVGAFLRVLRTDALCLVVNKVAIVH